MTRPPSDGDSRGRLKGKQPSMPASSARSLELRDLVDFINLELEPHSLF
ncbi:hypothetical protein GCM10023196_033880 [Actinoallomurus vinaceus]|uniref:Uncharacterized protein n=1 Tax=Actinoallomurus vinaceus TaxID=1080074 RepID=A0ABP8UAB0_9ACTN